MPTCRVAVHRDSDDEAYVYNWQTGMHPDDPMRLESTIHPRSQFATAMGGWNALRLQDTMDLIFGRRAPFRSKSGMKVAPQQFGTRMIRSQ
ncbi:uncharacterized protein N7483_001870 [Penicillium malachiteum]|uniref:uncharacterized protein n=1 Tax=Penicillium malachiteum TaxID=1324776 RepID=UPI0025497681|nr:uncharacterized protein N7483_001870 [Penicillium malachiteum]KAJ5736745.1 hypothetical protein N7483_001870 [Penicillium malachiteum]